MKHIQHYLIFFFFLGFIPNIFSQNLNPDFKRFGSSVFQNGIPIKIPTNCAGVGPNSFPIKVSDLPVLNGILQFDRIELALINPDINHDLQITLVSPNGTNYTIADGPGGDIGSWPSLYEGEQRILIFDCTGLYPAHNSPMIKYIGDPITPAFAVNGYEMPNMTGTDPNGIWNLKICNWGPEEIEILSTDLIFKSIEVYGGIRTLTNALDCHSKGTTEYFVSLGGCDPFKHFFIRFDDGPLEYTTYDPLEINGIIANRELTPGNHVMYLYKAIDDDTPDYTHERSYNFTIGVDNPDTEPPVLINCPSDSIYYFTVNDTVGTSFNLPTFTDNCGVVKATLFTTLLDGLKWDDGDPARDTLDFFTFPGGDLGGRTVGNGRVRLNFLVADAAGNTATCRTIFSYRDSIACANDTEPPVLINCPSDSIYYSVNDTVGIPLRFPTFTDNCQVMTATIFTQTFNGLLWAYEGNPDTLTTNFIEATGEGVAGIFVGTGSAKLDIFVADAAGNTATCNVTWTILDGDDCANDIVPPVLINCPADSIYYYTDNDTLPITIKLPTFTDNCQVVKATLFPQLLDGLIASNGDTYFNPFDFINSPGNIIGGDVVGTGRAILDFLVTDAAGNTATCSSTFTYSDSNKPTCHVNIGDGCVFPGMTTLIPVTVDKFIDIFAFQFNLKDPTNASLSLENIVNLHPIVSNLLFNKLSNGNIIILWDDVQSKARTLADGTKLFDIVVKATEEFNTPGVITTVGDVVVGGTDPNITLTFKPANICVQTGVTPKGGIKNPNGKVHAGVKVELIQSGNAVGSVNTGADGSYALGISPLENRVRPTKNDEIKKGISVIDAAKVRAHSLQKTLLTAPYSLIAADANRDGKVNVLDVSIINQIILTKLTAFPNNTSWRFLPKSLDISSDPLKKDWPDYIDLNQSNLDFNNLDFVSIKVGDVDHNSLLQDPVIEHRGVALALTIPDTIVAPTSNIQIPVRISGPDRILAIQMTINYDTTQVDFQSIASSTIPGFGAQHYNDLGGQVIIVWDHPQGLDFQPDGTLMTLNFNNKVNTGTSALTMSEISYYDATFNEIPVTSDNGSITFMPSSTNEVVKRHTIKASPNPFVDQANIEINTEAPQSLVLTLRDVSGKVIQTVRSEKMNHHHLKINNLAYRGVIFIYIEGETFSDTIRLIKM